MNPPHNETSTLFRAIGVDVGGTKTAIGLVTFPGGVVRARRIFQTCPERGGEKLLGEVERVASELAAEARADGQQIDGIGLGLCEIVNGDGEILSANCVDWTSSMVRKRLSAIAPTVIEADVRAGALAEALLGAGREARVFLYVSIGTGIASCLVIDGKPFTGARGATGTMASGPLPGFHEKPGEVLLPTLEQIASGPALVSRFNLIQGNAQTGEDVLAATANDPRAADVVRSAAEALGGGVGWLINILDPELVILGGGLGATEGAYRDQLVMSARRHVWWEGHRDLPIVTAQTGPDAGFIGAAATSWKRAQACCSLGGL